MDAPVDDSGPDRDDAQEGAPQIGEVLEGRYRLTGELGEGGIGAVYRAEHLKLGHDVAVKMLLPEYAGHRLMRPRFEREARALAALKHPNIVGLVDYSLSAGRPYLVMELLDGETLADRIKRGPLLPDVASAIARQTLAALIYAHAEGFVHRDLKPANLFVVSLPTEPHHVKLLDFGFVKLLEDGAAVRDGSASEQNEALTRSGVAFGTPFYMSPEQLTGDVVDERTDVYAVGVMLFEMLTGERPFVGTLPEIARQHLTVDVPIARVGSKKRASPHLQAVLDRAMAKAPADRFSSAAELAAALEMVDGPWLVTTPRGDAATVPVGVDPADPDDVALAPTVPPPARLREVPSTSPAPRRGSRRGLWIGLALASVLLGGAALYLALVSPGALSIGSSASAERATAAPLAAAEPPERATQLREPTEPSVAEPSAPERSAQEPSVPEPASPDAPAEMELTEADLEPTVSMEEPASFGPSPFETRAPVAVLTQARSRLASDAQLDQLTHRRLMGHARANRGDPRPHLLLAHSFLRLGRPTAALERAQLALRVSRDARGDPQLLQDLVVLATTDETHAGAALAIRRHYGPAAAPALQAKLDEPSTTGRARRALEQLLGQLDVPVPTPAAARPARRPSRRGRTSRRSRRSRRGHRRRR